jgi:D-serine deaminase-like pyridoxal phosphate-dependent protein
MDADYGRNLDRYGAPDQGVRAEAIRVGDRAEPPDRGPRDRRRRPQGARLRRQPPLVCDEPAATYERASDEHGRLGISGATNRLGLGDKIRLIPGHCDPTVNLHAWYVAIRSDCVEQLWPITARGAVY